VGVFLGCGWGGNTTPTKEGLDRLRCDAYLDANVTGEELRDSRAAAGLTQRQLAARLGISQPQIARWERGENAIGGPQEIALRTVLTNGTGKVPAKPAKRSKRVS
jgi:DNA-binding transcriptional regulator YiaG